MPIKKVIEGRTPVKLTTEEIDDCISALQFFIEKYPDRKGSVETRRAMKKLIKKMWGFLK